MAAPQNEASLGLKDCVHVFEDDATHLEIADIKLEETSTESLGDSQNAREGYAAVDITVGLSSLAVVIDEIQYGSNKGLPACRVRMTWTVKSDSDFRLSKADLACIVASDSTSQLSASSNDVLRPSILRIGSPPKDDPNPTTTQQSETSTFSPSVSMPNGPTVTVGSLAIQEIFPRQYGWHLHSIVRSSDPQHQTTMDTGSWTFTANKKQKDSTWHSFDIEFLIGHGGLPFYTFFELEARLVFSGSVRTIGKRKKIRTQRNFAPYDSQVVF